MGEKERGLPDTPSTSEPSDSVTSATCLPSTLTPKVGLGTQPLVVVPKTAGVARPWKGRGVSTTGAGDGWATTWRQVVWDKWRWGVFIALAVVVSRITTST